MGRAIFVAGLGFGDEGKGSSVDFLARLYDAKVVVRYNGGAQAGHRVTTSNGKEHIFSQVGSGIFAGAHTFLSRTMMVNPITFLNEVHHLVELGCFPLVSVDREALVTTPFHIAANRLYERKRGRDKHGSCGLGIGETMSDYVSDQECLFVQDIDHPSLYKKLSRIQERKRSEVLAKDADPKGPSVEWDVLNTTSSIDQIVERFRTFQRNVAVVDRTALLSWLKQGTVIFEGAQGVLLDQDYGFHPYTTWSDCTFGNADRLLEDLLVRQEVLRLGVLRAYATRHGAGPFVSEDPRFDACSSHDHNEDGEWQGRFRSGAFDFVMARYALDVIGKVDGLILTNLDRLTHAPQVDSKVPTVMEYFSHAEKEGGIISHVPRSTRRGDLSFQEDWTNVLMGSTPHTFENLPTGLDYAKEVSRMLGVPLFATSYGTTANDKKVHG